MKVEARIFHNKWNKDSCKTILVNAKSFYDAVYDFRQNNSGYSMFYRKNNNTYINYDWTIKLRRVQ